VASQPDEDTYCYPNKGGSKPADILNTFSARNLPYYLKFDGKLGNFILPKNKNKKKSTKVLNVLKQSLTFF